MTLQLIYCLISFYFFFLFITLENDGDGWEQQSFAICWQPLRQNLGSSCSAVAVTESSSLYICSGNILPVAILYSLLKSFSAIVNPNLSSVATSWISLEFWFVWCVLFRWWCKGDLFFVTPPILCIFLLFVLIYSHLERESRSCIKVTICFFLSSANVQLFIFLLAYMIPTNCCNGYGVLLYTNVSLLEKFPYGRITFFEIEHICQVRWQHPVIFNTIYCYYHRQHVL